MKLNNLPLISYEQGAATASFVLDCEFQDALALDGQELKITETIEPGQEQTLAVYGGYHITALELTIEDYTRASFAKTLDPETAQAISALEQNLTITNQNLVTTNENVASAQQSASTANAGIIGLTAQIEANAGAIEELAAAIFTEE